jgi:hypothetical protein
VQSRSHLLLRSVVFDTLWLPQTEVAAGCNRVWTRLRTHMGWHGGATHDVPVWRCNCGIHAAKSPELAAEYLYLYSTVHQPGVLARAIGLVSLWGGVVEGDNGWRASYAYPKKLFLPKPEGHDDAEALRAGLAEYGVPIDFVEGEETPVARAVRRVRRDRRRGRQEITRSA